MKSLRKILLVLASAALLAACGNKSAYSTMGFTTTNGIADTQELYAPDADGAKAQAPSVEGDQEAVIGGDKLVYTGSISLETLDYETTVSEVKKRIADYKGIIENQSESSDDYYWYQNEDGDDHRTLYLTVRIPTVSFQEFLDGMEGSGHVVSKSSNVENITKQYSDNSVEIEALEKQQTRLLEMLDEAQSVEDMIAIESRLSEVETQLNQKKNTQAQMDTDVEYSTVNVQVSEVSKYTETERHPLDNFASRFVEGVKNGWHDFLWFLQELVIRIVAALPYLILIGLVIFLIRKWGKKHPERRLFKRKQKDSVNEKK